MADLNLMLPHGGLVMGHAPGETDSRAMRTWRECHFAPRQLTSDKWGQYFDVYEERFGRHRQKPSPVYIEIGSQGGGSLETARLYFGGNAKIYGVDIDPACDTLNKVPFIDRVFIGDQSDPGFLESVIKQVGTPDIILDDGSHHAYDVVVSFLTLFPHLVHGGTYLIEDTFCDFWPTHQKLYHGQSIFDFFNSLNR